MEDIVIAQHSKALTVLEGHEKHLNMEPPHPLVATVKGGVSATQCVRVSVSSQFCPLTKFISFQYISTIYLFILPVH